MLRFGIWLPYSHAQWVTNMARLAEQSGWDGVFFREQVVGLDRWIPIAAAALGTQKILIGGVISPTTSANQNAILDEAHRIHRRSGKRLVVCLGGWYQAGKRADPHAALTLTGEPRSASGADTWPTQGLVVWRIGIWPNRNSILEALNYQGIIPVTRQATNSLRAPTRHELKQLVKFIGGTNENLQDFEIVVEITGTDSGPEPLNAEVESWEAVGATWGIIHYHHHINVAREMNQLQDLIRLGPPG